MSKHTKEPWYMGSNLSNRHQICATLDDGAMKVVAEANWNFRTEAQADSERIVACVNACAGMEDPQKEIEALRAEVARLKEELEDLGYELIEAHEQAVDVDNS